MQIVSAVRKAMLRFGYPEGLDGDSCGYAIGAALVNGGFANTFILKVWEGGSVNAREEALQMMQNAKFSPLLGFTLDTSEISDIYGNLVAIADVEYGPGFKSGSASDADYEAFIKKLYAAGLQGFLDEANRQITEWKANK